MIPPYLQAFVLVFYALLLYALVIAWFVERLTGQPITVPMKWRLAAAIACWRLRCWWRGTKLRWRHALLCWRGGVVWEGAWHCNTCPVSQRFDGTYYERPIVRRE